MAKEMSKGLKFGLVALAALVVGGAIGGLSTHFIEQKKGLAYPQEIELASTMVDNAAVVGTSYNVTINGTLENATINNFANIVDVKLSYTAASGLQAKNKEMQQCFTIGDIDKNVFTLKADSIPEAAKDKTGTIYVLTVTSKANLNVKGSFKFSLVAA